LGKEIRKEKKGGKRKGEDQKASIVQLIQDGERGQLRWYAKNQAQRQGKRRFVARKL